VGTESECGWESGNGVGKDGIVWVGGWSDELVGLLNGSV
jgi:hypothetical protein